MWICVQSILLSFSLMYSSEHGRLAAKFFIIIHNIIRYIVYFIIYHYWGPLTRSLHMKNKGKKISHCLLQPTLIIDTILVCYSCWLEQSTNTQLCYWI
jgi:hypothetical protein